MLDECWDWPGLADAIWRGKGHPPGWLSDRTPHELLTLFGTDRPDENAAVDPLAELARWNHRAAGRGQQPATPDYLMPGVPRRGRTP